MKYSLFAIVCLIGIAGCQRQKHKVSGKNAAAKTASSYTPKKDTVIKKADTPIKKVYPQTDSGRLMMHLDSLPVVKFSYESDGQTNNNPIIDLSVFKNRKLFHIPFQRIPTELGGGGLDDPESPDSTFNMVDSVTCKAEWTLVAGTPKFLVVDNWPWGILMTLSYNFEVIDAIHSSTGAGNNHWQIGRTTKINKDLTMVLHHTWSMQTDEKGNYEYEHDEQNWYIDSTGHFKQQHLQHKRRRRK